MVIKYLQYEYTYWFDVRTGTNVVMKVPAKIKKVQGISDSFKICNNCISILNVIVLMTKYLKWQLLFFLLILINSYLLLFSNDSLTLY